MTATTTAEPKRYRVCAPYVSVKVAGSLGLGARDTGWTILGFYRNAILPPGAHADGIEQLLAGGYIETVE